MTHLHHHQLSAPPAHDNVPAFLHGIRNYADYGDMLQACIASALPGGLHMEFGVASGSSLSFLRSIIPPHVPLYGFDSFQGLPESWNGLSEGYFACPIPNVEHTTIVVGLFADTLYKFAQAARGRHVSFMHIDCDLYASAKTVFDAFRDLIVPGTVIVFDEYFGYPNWEQHEHKAFMEFIDETDHLFDYIAHDHYYRVGVMITD